MKILTLIKIYLLVKDFIDKNINYQKYMCNGCHDTSLKAIILHN